MSDYIICLGRPNKPQLHYKVCELCEKHQKCLAYRTWNTHKCQAEVKDKSKWDEETKKREGLLKSLIQNKSKPEVKKARKVRRAKG